MNLIEIISDKPPEHKKELSELRFLDRLKEKCRNSYEVIKQCPIYVPDSGPDFMLVTPEQREVKTSFWLDLIVKDLPSWHRYPSRSKYIRGFTSQERAGNLDEVYVLIPFDLSRIGICPKSSFYRSFVVAQKDMGVDRLDNSGLIQWVNLLVAALIDVRDEKSINKEVPKTYKQFKSLLDNLDKIISDEKNTLKKRLKESDSIKDDERLVLQDVLGRHVTTIHRYLEEKFDPETNGFTTVRAESYNRVNEDREVWVASPSLMVKKSVYLDMYKRGAVK